MGHRTSCSFNIILDTFLCDAMFSFKTTSPVGDRGPKHFYQFTIMTEENSQKQAGAELCQAHVKLRYDYHEFKLAHIYYI